MAMDDALFRPFGHDKPRQWLRSAFEQNRVAGTYLFVGADGVGKSAVAIEFAATVRCESLYQGWACGACNECRRVAKGIHPSVRSFRKPDDKSFFPVEIAREITDLASLKALEHGRRVFVIEDADRFNDASANALLKTLEEPSGNSVFILIASNLAQVLPTIRSRSQSVLFSALSVADMDRVAKDFENLPLNPDSRDALFRIAQGSPGKLRQMLDSGVADAAREFLRLVEREPWSASDKLMGVVDKAKDTEGRRERLRLLITLLGATLRDRLVTTVATDAPILTRVGTSPEPLTSDMLLGSLETLDEIQQQVDSNVNWKLCCDRLATSWPVV